MQVGLPDQVTASLDRQYSREELQELQHLAELGRLSATLLHEISNPLTAALLSLEQYHDQNAPAIRQAKRSILHLRRYVEAARQQVRRQSTLADFKIRRQVAQVRRVVEPLAKKAGVQLLIDKIPDCRLFGDEVKFQQILANLLVNAVEAYGNTDNLLKPVKLSIASAEHNLVIEVSDWGLGIHANQIKRLFEPFYTTKSQAGHGLGIGLAIVQQYVADDFGGKITVSSTRRKGTVFKITLPALYRPV